MGAFHGLIISSSTLLLIQVVEPYMLRRVPYSIREGDAGLCFFSLF